MKILVINYRYFVSGGPERYMFNLIELLESKGHKVIPFSIRYKKNRYSEYSKYFASPLSTEDEVYFREQRKNIKSIFKSITRAFYSFEVYRKLSQLINDTKPDFAVVLHYQRKLSPSVISVLDKKKIPFVVRLSDFAMICPNAHLIRNNKVCEECISKGLWQSVKYSCVQNSKGASLINYLSLIFQKKIGVFEKIPIFAVPSKFTIEKHIQAGWENSKFFHVPTFVKICTVSTQKKREDRILFIGRIERAKGVHILLEAAYRLKKEEVNFEIYIIGKGDKKYLEELKAYSLYNKLSMVKFLGFLEKDEIFTIIQKSKATVIPSIWYENLPNSALESLACGTPIIASNLGSLKELVIEGENGYLFEHGNSIDLAEKIKEILIHKNFDQMQKNILDIVKKRFSQELHYKNIMSIYYNLIKG